MARHDLVTCQAMVSELWKPLFSRIEKGENIDFDVGQIDSIIDSAERICNASDEIRQLECKDDIRQARIVHDFNKHWSKQTALTITNHWERQKEQHDWNDKFATQLVQEGLKYILALHGALALACMNGLASGKAAWKGLFAGGLAVAAVGLLCVGLAQAVLTMHAVSYRNQLTKRLIKRGGWRALKAVERWRRLGGIKRRLRLVDQLVFGSTTLFAIYIFLFLIIGSGI